jgi:hypothetical protein
MGPHESSQSDRQSPSASEAARAGAGGSRPPAVPGYVLHTLLGRGTYGEVWQGENRTTKRQVAVKFLHSRAALDWSLLDGETEKLAFLAADRRVVQLLDVGRDADPPYFVMEYIGRGSLAQHLADSGRLPLDSTVAIFEEIALGLMHVHAKGVLHCDLKPSNILLDDECRPRLADFGQSRLTEDRSPTLALGTMFFMAPEQAAPAAVPDARWDVYALGAVLYTMLEGRPPHQSEEAVTAIRSEPDLAARLARYRHLVLSAGGPPGARRIDRPLRDILARCLAPDPRLRFATVQEVVEALRLRRDARARRPTILLGVLGPALVLAVTGVFAVRGYREATSQSADAIRRRAFESNQFAAAFIARSFEGEIRHYFEIVSEEAARPAFRAAFDPVTALPDLQHLAATGAVRDGPASADLVQHFRNDRTREALDAYLRERLAVHLAQVRRDPKAPRFVSMFTLDPAGTHLAAAYSDPEARTKSVGRYFGWRSYFHGGPQDLPHNTLPGRITPIQSAHLSAPFRSTTTRGWRVGVSTPLFRTDGGRRVLAGVLVLSVDIGNFDFLAVEDHPPHDRFAVLVDARASHGGGRIVLHPYFDDSATPDPAEPDAGARRPVIDIGLLDRLGRDWRLDYHDPVAQTPGAEVYRGSWIAAAQPVQLPGALPDQPAAPGLMVLVQERANAVTGPVEQLGRRLMADGAFALSVIAVTLASLWLLAWRGRWPRLARAGARGAPLTTTPRPLRERSTLSETSSEHA